MGVFVSLCISVRKYVQHRTTPSSTSSSSLCMPTLHAYLLISPPVSHPHHPTLPLPTTPRPLSRPPHSPSPLLPPHHTLVDRWTSSSTQSSPASGCWSPSSWASSSRGSTPPTSASSGRQSSSGESSPTRASHSECARAAPLVRVGERVYKITLGRASQ